MFTMTHGRDWELRLSPTALWSNTNFAEAHWTGCSYAIISDEEGKAALTNSFLLLDEEESKHFANENIEF